MAFKLCIDCNNHRRAWKGRCITCALRLIQWRINKQKKIMNEASDVAKREEEEKYNSLKEEKKKILDKLEYYKSKKLNK